MDIVHTFGFKSGRTSGRIAYVFGSSQHFLGLECASSPTLGTAFLRVRGLRGGTQSHRLMPRAVQLTNTSPDGRSPAPKVEGPSHAGRPPNERARCEGAGQRTDNEQPNVKETWQPGQDYLTCTGPATSRDKRRPSSRPFPWREAPKSVSPRNRPDEKTAGSEAVRAAQPPNPHRGLGLTLKAAAQGCGRSAAT